MHFLPGKPQVSSLGGQPPPLPLPSRVPLLWGQRHWQDLLLTRAYMVSHRNMGSNRQSIIPQQKQEVLQGCHLQAALSSEGN